MLVNGNFVVIVVCFYGVFCGVFLQCDIEIIYWSSIKSSDIELIHQLVWTDIFPIGSLFIYLFANNEKATNAPLI